MSKAIKISAERLWTTVLPICMKITNTIPKQYYNVLTPIKSLQEKIDSTVIKEFLSDKSNMEVLLDEIEWKNYYKYQGEYYVTCTSDITDLEEIINKVYNVDWYNCTDDYVTIERRFI